MLASVDEVVAASGSLGTLVTQERASLVALLCDDGSTRAAIDGSLEDFDSKRDPLTRRILTAHAAFKQAIERRRPSRQKSLDRVSQLRRTLTEEGWGRIIAKLGQWRLQGGLP